MLTALKRDRTKAALAGGAAVALFCVAVLAHFGAPARATLWCAVMLASFLGWGSLVNRWLAPRKRMDWGLRAAWGFAAYVLTGGFLALVHLAVRPVILTHAAAGVVLWAVDWAIQGRRRWWSPTFLRRYGVVLSGRVGVLALLAGAYAMTTLTFFAFLGHHEFQPSDDPPFYFFMAEKLLQTGSLFEPFNARRVSLFGGEAYLNATFLSVASTYYMHAVDGGLAFVIVVGLVVGLICRPNARAHHAVPLALTLLLLFSLEDVRTNTNSEMTGVASILALYRTVRVPFETGRDRPLWPMETGRMIALGALTLVPMLLRMSNGPAMLMFTGLVFLFDFLTGTRLPWTRASWKPLLRAALITAGTFLALLLPWAILQKQSSNTFFYPFGHPNVTPGWTLLTKPATWGAEGQELIGHFFYGRPLAVMIPFIVAGLVPTRGPGRNDVSLFVIGSFIGLVVFAYQAVAFGPNNTARYYFAFIAAIAIVSAASVERNGPRAALIAAALGMHLAVSRDETRHTLESYVTRAFASLDETGFHAYEALSADYVDTQSYVPAGATIAVAVFEPFRFDFKRNTIQTLDLLGGMGPKPGWPAHKGPQALSDYLVANGVKYLVHVDFGLASEFYNRDHWKSHLSKEGSYLQGEAVLQLDAEDSIEKLAKMRRVLNTEHGMTVISLTEPPAPPVPPTPPGAPASTH